MVAPRVIGQNRSVEPVDVLLDAIIEILGGHAMDHDQIAAELVRTGRAKGNVATVVDQVAKALHLDTRFSTVADGVIYMPAIADGTVWTIRVDAEDAADGFVRANPQLMPITWWLIGDALDFVDASGAVIGSVETDGIDVDGVDTDVVFLPDDWVADADDVWVSVAVRPTSLCLNRIDAPPAPTQRQIRALVAGFDRAARTETVTLFDGATATFHNAFGDGPMHEALMIDRDAFIESPVPWLPDLYRAANLEERSNVIARNGFDWATYDIWRERNRLHFSYGLEPRQIDLLTIVVGACGTYAEQGPAGLGGDERQRDSAAMLMAAVLEDGLVAEAFWDECERREITPEQTLAFAEEIVGRVGGDPSAGLGWVLARSLDFTGDAVAAAVVLEDLADADCDHVPLLLEAAAMAADSGNAVAAMRLLLQAAKVEPDLLDGWTDDEAREVDLDEPARLAREVAGFASNRPRALAGRNDPCPCGSGRKYKACHLGREQHSLHDRAGWLYDKARRFMRARDPEVAVELAADLAEGSRDRYDELVDSPFVTDLALHEEGVFADFLESRSAVLPDDEAMLAAQWELVDRGVFEVVRVAGDRLDLRNVALGDEITVVNTTPNSRTTVGTLMVGRPLPVCDTYRAFGGFMSVPRQQANAMLAAVESGSADAVVDVVAATLRPPTLTNTDGDSFEAHLLRWRVPDPALVDDALLGAELARVEGEPRWHLTQPGRGGSATIVAAVWLEGDELVADVNSA